MIFNGVLWSFSWKLKAGVEYLWCWPWSEHFHNDEPRRVTKFSVSELVIFRQTIFKRCSRLFLLIALLVLYFTELAVYGLRGNEAPLFFIFVFSS